MLTVGIVNDLAIARHALKSIVGTTPGFRVLWEAADGQLALDRHRENPADIILLDLIMPVMDGVRATPMLMAVRPCAILIVTATVTGNRQMVFAAMSAGALDAVDTPGVRSEAMAGPLRRKLISVGRLVRQTNTTPSVIPQPGPKLSVMRPVAAEPSAQLRIVGIGASTGGPQAFATILRGLPPTLQAAIVLVQHLDKHFVPGLQQWLQSDCSLPVQMVSEDTALAAGTVYLAYTEDHIVLQQKTGGAVFATYTTTPEASPHRPSVDTFFQSMMELKSFPRLGILLTGMGRDGAAGLYGLRRSGGATIVQDQATSVVYGMPRAALEAGAAANGTPLPDISSAITAWVTG